MMKLFYKFVSNHNKPYNTICSTCSIKKYPYLKSKRISSILLKAIRNTVFQILNITQKKISLNESFEFLTLRITVQGVP